MSNMKKAIAPLGINFWFNGTFMYSVLILLEVTWEESPWFNDSIIVALIQGQKYLTQYDWHMTYGMTYK
jgi:hypothetical protein